MNMYKKHILLTISVIMLVGGLLLTYQIYTAPKVSVNIEKPYEEQETVVRTFEDIKEANTKHGFERTETASQKLCDTDYQAVDSGIVLCTHGSD